MKSRETNLIPPPEPAGEPAPGSDDGRWIFDSHLAALKNNTVAQSA